MTDEWTADYVEKLELDYGWEGVAHNHNAALAAERERYDDLQRSVMDLSHPNCKGLLNERNEARQQLAAERERLKEPAWIQVIALEKQLAAEREELASIERSRDAWKRQCAEALDQLAAEKEQVLKVMAENTELCEELNEAVKLMKLEDIDAAIAKLER